MTNELDSRLAELKQIADAKANLETRETKLRSEIFDKLKEENADYKSELASAVITKRTSVKVLDQESLINRFKKQKLVKYYKTEVVLKPEFFDDVKAGILSDPDVKVETTEGLQIRFAKPKE